MHRHATGPLLVSVVLLSGSTASALQSLHDGAYAIRATHTTSTPGTVEVHQRQSSEWIEPGAPLQPTAVRVYATSNANDAFTLDLRYPSHGGSSCERGLLSLGGEARVSDSWGGDATACSIDFQLDPGRAALAATVFHTTRQERHPIGMHVTGTFATPRRSYPAGAPIEIVVTLTSPPGSPTVQWQRGGSNRGPRDNQFSFSITRDGQPVPLLDGMDFGGLSQLLALPAASSAEVRTELAPWADLGQPGHYVVECSYATIFVPDGVELHGETTMGEIWDRTFTSSVSFDVRAH